MEPPHALHGATFPCRLMRAASFAPVSTNSSTERNPHAVFAPSVSPDGAPHFTQVPWPITTSRTITPCDLICPRRSSARSAGNATEVSSIGTGRHYHNRGPALEAVAGRRRGVQPRLDDVLDGLRDRAHEVEAGPLLDRARGDSPVRRVLAPVIVQADLHVVVRHEHRDDA